MANFAPLKNRFCMVLERNLDLFSIRGSFLDYGCGRGDVSEYLLSQCGMTEGVAYDPAFSDDAVKEKSAHPPHPRLTYANKLEASQKEVDLAVLFDVIEHVPDAAATLREVRDHVGSNGWLAVTVPYNAHEWGEDDEFYGHLRRLSRRGVISLIENSGWDVIRVLDPTFPSFWFMRRLYLLSRKILGARRGRPQNMEGSDAEKSLASSVRSSWDTGGVAARFLAGDIAAWNLIRRFDLYFESVFLGFELFVLCQRRENSNVCEVCENGAYSYHKFFDRYSFQRCSYCGSERLLPDALAPGYANVEEKVRPPLIEGIIYRARRSRIRLIRKYDPPERSLLDIRCGRGLVPAYFKKRGWRALGTVSSPDMVAVAGQLGADVIPADVLDIPLDRTFGVVTLFHVIEHVRNLKSALDHVDQLLLPGGYLVLEYPNDRSLLKSVFQRRWFGYDPPFHRLLINPRILADRMGLRNYRLIKESHFSPEYSFFIFAQSLANVLLPFQRDALYNLLQRRKLSALERAAAYVTMLILVLSAPLFLIYQPVASLLRKGCIVRQIFRKTDVPAR